MKENRLSGLALMHIHKHNVSLNSEDIVDDFAAPGSRRMEILFRLAKVPFSQMQQTGLPYTAISINLVSDESSKRPSQHRKIVWVIVNSHSSVRLSASATEKWAIALQTFASVFQKRETKTHTNIFVSIKVFFYLTAWRKKAIGSLSNHGGYGKGNGTKH